MDYEFVTEFGANEDGTSLMYPEGIVVDQRGYVYVADAGNNRIVKYCVSKIIINKKLGLDYLENKKWDEAIQSFQKALEEDPEDIDSRKAIAFAYFENGRIEQAIQQYDLILQKYPQNQNINFKLTEAHFALADKYAKEDNYREALSHYRIVLKNQPDYPEIKTKYYLAFIKYLYYSKFFKLGLIAILSIIVFFFIMARLSNKKRKGGKHYRHREPF